MRLPSWQLIIGIVLSWIGLSGVADGLVEWKDWFEIGWMEHWRALKNYIILIVFSWLPFRVPSWTIDYFTLGLLTLRGVYSGIIELKRQKNMQSRYILNPIILAVLFWPVFWAYCLLSYIGIIKRNLRGHLYRLYRAQNYKIYIFLLFPVILVLQIFGKSMVAIYPARKQVSLFIIYSVLSFIPFLFVVSDIMYTFGFYQRP